MNFTFKMDSTDEILRKRDLENGGRVQKIIDNEIMRYMEPYMQLRTNHMIESMFIATVAGSGEIKVNTPYARRVHYSKTPVGKNFKDPLRGPYYFKRMKADKGDLILQAARKASGAK